MIRKGVHPSAVIEGASLPASTIVEPLAVIYVGLNGRLVLGEMNTIYPGATIRIDQGWMVTGEEVSFGSGCHIYEPRAGLSIGNRCMIGGGVLICGVNHGPTRHHKSQSLPVEIGDDAWIGMGAVIAPGVTIGSGAMVAAGAVVVKDVPTGAMVAGVPARYIRDR